MFEYNSIDKQFSELITIIKNDIEKNNKDNKLTKFNIPTHNYSKHILKKVWNTIREEFNNISTIYSIFKKLEYYQIIKSNDSDEIPIIESDFIIGVDIYPNEFIIDFTGFLNSKYILEKIEYDSIFSK